jgi:hypothetical protein
MEIFFDEFEEYVKNKYGEESYLKKLMEQTLLPLKEALEKITTDDIVESLFGKVDSPSILKDPIKKLSEAISSYTLSPSTLNPQIASQNNEVESGLVEKPKEVILVDIGNDALNKIYGAISQDGDNESKAKPNTAGGGGSASNLIGMLLKGGLVIAGLTALMGGFFTDGKWKGTMKLAANALLSLSGLQRGIKSFFGGVVEGVSKFAKFFGETKIIQNLAKMTGFKTMMANMASGKGVFGFLGKGLKFLKRISYLGSVIAFAFAYSRFKAGDDVGGWLEIASGIANFFPGIGTAISIGIDMITALKDYSTGGPAGAKDMTVGEQGKAMLDAIPSFISENLTKFGEWFKNTIVDNVMDYISKGKEVLKNLPFLMGEGLTKGVINMGEFIGEKMESLDGYIQENGGLGTIAKNILESGWDLLKNKVFPGIFNGINALGKMIFNSYSDVGGMAKEFFKGAFSALDETFDIKNHISDFKNSFMEKWNLFIEKLKSAPMEFLKGISSGISTNASKVIGFFKKDDNDTGSESAAKKGEYRSRNTKRNIIESSEEDYRKNMAKRNKESLDQLKTTNDRVAKSEDIYEMGQMIVEAIVENSNVSAQGSALVATTVGNNSGQSVSNVVVNGGGDSSPTRRVRRSGRDRVGAG